MVGSYELQREHTEEVYLLHWAVGRHKAVHTNHISFCATKFLQLSVHAKKVQKQQQKKAAVYVHSAFLRERSQSLHWVIITGSI